MKAHNEGPIPIGPLAEDIIALCVHCLGEVSGPPQPFCCEGRKRLILNVLASTELTVISTVGQS